MPNCRQLMCLWALVDSLLKEGVVDGMTSPNSDAIAVVTGGAGFLGSHLVERLLREGHRVRVFDKLVRGTNWVQSHVDQGTVEFVQADLLDFEALVDTVQGASVVWHLAGNTDIPAGVSDTELDVRNAVLGTRTVLEAMRSTGVKGILFPSTGAVYGDAKVVPTPETYGPLLPNSLYGAGKLGCEGLISAYCSMFGIRARIFRLGNVIGSRMGHGIIYDFINKLSQNPSELEILGDGQGAKNYFLAEECVDGIMYFFRNGFSDNHTSCDIINIGTDASTSVMKIAQIIIEEMGLDDVKYRFTGGVKGWLGDQPKVFLDVTKAKNLGWVARNSSEHAVRVAARRYLDKE